MKKTILKFAGIAVMAALMIFNIQFFEADDEFRISLTYLENTAYAFTEDHNSIIKDHYMYSRPYASDFDPYFFEKATCEYNSGSTCNCDDEIPSLLSSF